MRKKAYFLITILLLPIFLSGFYVVDYCIPLLKNTEEVDSQILVANHSEKLEIEKMNYGFIADMVWPVENVSISSYWGWRNSCFRCSKYHQGIDFDSGLGSDVFSVMPGTVTEIQHQGEYGLHVIIEHKVYEQTWKTVYAHLKRNSVPENLEVGSEVEMGEKIGEVGNTGLSTGPHLHFEIRLENKKLDPLPILEKNVINNSSGV